MMIFPAFRFVPVLAASFAALTLSGAVADEAVRLVSADLKETSGPLDTVFKRCAGAGRANEGLHADWQRQLAVVRSECGFEYHSAAYILDKLKHCGDAAQSMSYWTFTDIFEESAPRWQAFHSGFGLMNYQDIKKPAYFAYQFLNRLGPTEVKSSDPSSWICTDNTGGVQALIWDFTNTFPGKDMINQVFYKRDLPAQPKGGIALNLSHLPAGKYAVETYKVGYRVNTPYATYKDLGAPAQLTKDQVSKIKSENSGKSVDVRTVEIGADGKFERQFDLRENDAVLITVKPQP